MKKLYTAALAALCLEFTVSAEKTTFKWETPGTVAIVTDQISNDPVVLAADQTEYVYEYSGSGYIWLYSVDGYAITKVIKEGDTKSLSSSKSQKAGYGSQISPFIGSSFDGKTVTVSMEKVVNDDSFTVNVENGAQYIKTSLYATWKDNQNVSHGYTTSVALQEGKNTVSFNSTYSNKFEFNLIKGGNADKIYSAKFNGTEQNGGMNYYFGPYSPVSTDVFDIRVFETQESEIKTCTLTFDIPENLKDCIKSIRDWRKNEFVSLADNKAEVYQNSDIQVNFNDDFTLTKIMLGTKDITDTYNTSNNSVRFSVTESVTFSVEGSETVYGDVEFTAYVLNPEGVYISKGIYGGIRNNLSDSAEGEGVAITSDIQLPESVISAKDGSSLKIKGSVMTPENTKIFKIKVSEKNPNLYISSANGYFIKAVWNSTLTSPLPYATKDEGTTIYIVAQKIDNSIAANVNVIGSEPLVFQASTAFSMMWDNHPSTFGLMPGEQTLYFDAEYDNPFSLRPQQEMNNFEAYLDGWKLSPDDNGVYQVNFYTGNANISLEEGSGNEEGEETIENRFSQKYSTRAENSTEQEKRSTLTVYADGTTKGSVGSVLVNSYDGMSADCYYSNLDLKAPTNSFTLLAGTPVTIEPHGEKFYMSLNNELIYGYKNNQLVNKLTDGKYTFSVERQKLYVFEIAEDLDAPDTSAVTEIEASENSDSLIYNIHGICVGKNIEDLPAGIYIINGKKVIK